MLAFALPGLLLFFALQQKSSNLHIAAFTVRSVKKKDVCLFGAFTVQKGPLQGTQSSQQRGLCGLEEGKFPS